MSVFLAVQPVERPCQLFGKADDQRQGGLGKPLGECGCKEFGVRVRFRVSAVLDELPEGVFVHAGEHAAGV